MIVTCQTRGCDNENISIEIADRWTAPDGSEKPVTVVQCGVCLGWILPPPEEESEAVE